MVFQNKQYYYWCFVAVVPLLISSYVGVVTSFVTETPTFAATRKGVALSPSLSPPPTTSTSSSLELSNYDSEYYTPTEQSPQSGTQSPITLTRFLSQYVKDHPELKDLENILLAVQMACKTIANLVNRAGLVYSIQHSTTDDISQGAVNEPDYKSDGRYYSMKRLDKLSTTVLKNALKFTGTVQMIVPEAKEIAEQPGQHQPGVLIAYDQDNIACLDPLDGSGNADASICSGTVFGVFEKAKTEEINEETLLEAVLQPGRNMRAAGYCLYSSATVLVFTLGESVYGFTLDPQIQEFVLTHDRLTIPARGNVYSCNEANSEGWGDSWKAYLKNLKLGQGETQQRYALRYVGSMVGDIHRTLLYGGVFAYPSSKLHKPQGNLQLLYKSAPLAFVMHHAGGKAMDESGDDLLNKRPERIHQKSPCFLGSSEDMDELKKYLTGLQN